MSADPLDPLEALRQKRCAQTLFDLVAALPPRHRKVAAALHLSDSPPTHQALADLLGLSRQRITQLADEASVMMRLRATRTGVLP